MKKERKYEWKGALKALLVIAVICAGIGFAMAAWDDTKSTGDTLTAAEWNAMVADQKNRTAAGAYSYLVGVNTANDNVPGDTGYWVKNSSGMVVFTESDPNHAENAIQYAIDNLPQTEKGGGGTIFLNGMFNISNTIKANIHRLTLVGAGIESTTLKLADNANCNILEQDSDDYNYWLLIEHICFDANDAENTAGSCIKLNKTRDVLIFDCFLRNAAEYGLYVVRPYNLNLIGTVIEHCNEAGLFTGPVVEGTYDGRDVKVIGGKIIWNEGRGAHICSNHVSIAHVYFMNNGYEGLWVDGSEGLVISDCEFVHNSYGHTGTYSQIKIKDAHHIKICQNFIDGDNVSKYGVEVLDTATEVLISDNSILNHVTAPIYDGATSTKIHDNTGYVTENSGTAIIANGNTSVVVNHGLAKAPEHGIRLTGTHSEVANCWVTNVTDTQFTINAPSAVTADRYVFWKAEV